MDGLDDMDDPKTAQELISRIEAHCAEEYRAGAGAHIFRGENRLFDGVTSGIYRKYEEIFNDHFQPVHIEQEIVEQAKPQFPDAASAREILTDLRHFGAATALVDFSRSLFVALFFACNGEADKDGRLIALNAAGLRDLKDIDYADRTMDIGVLDPARTALSRPRAEAQSSVFVHAPQGFIPQDRYQSFTVPEALKADCLRYLSRFHNIREATVYNDLFGFIDGQRNFEMATISFYRGVAKAKLDRFPEAIAAYDAAIRLKPDLAEAYYNRGVAKAELGHFKDAIDDYDEAIRLKPDDADAYANRGLAKAKRGDYGDAVADCDAAIRLNPDDADAYTNRGAAKAKDGREEDAIADWDEAIRLNPGHADAYANRGLAKAKLGDTDGARDDLRAALDLATEQNRQELANSARERLSRLDNPGEPEPD